jgi:Bardet-Biedl syndrome 7 protein
MSRSAERAKALVKDLPATSLPAERPSGTEPKEVATAYKNGLRTVHTMQAGEACDLLGVDPRKGLASHSAAERFKKYGGNSLSQLQLSLLGESAWAERRYEAPVWVYRDAAFLEVAPIDLVVGDIIYVEEGQDIPADLRILRAELSRRERFRVDRNGSWEPYMEDVSTVVDPAIPSGAEPFNAQAGGAPLCFPRNPTHTRALYFYLWGGGTRSADATRNDSFDSANNIAFRGSFVASGALLGLVFAAGACVWCEWGLTRGSPH